MTMDNKEHDIQLFKPTYAVDECLAEIRECLEVGWTGLGFKTVKFEEAWKAYTGLPHAHYLNSATAGLNMAVEILKQEKGWADGDEIITSPLTFISTNHAIALSNMHAVFADIDNTNCLDPKSVEERITDKTRAVIFVGFGGNAGHYEEVAKICKEHGLSLILDAAHMSGTRLHGEIPGKDADVVVYSYQAVKNLPTADSGMICFKEEKYDAIARKIGWLGINKDTYSRTVNAGNYKWKYDVEYVGNKLHGNSIMASIGLVQLKYLDRDNAYRKEMCKWYRERFSKYPELIEMIHIPEECDSSCHLFQIIVAHRDEMLLALNAAGIYPGVHYTDNTQYRMYAYAQGTCPRAAYVSDHVISLPLHMRLTRDDIEYICDQVIKIAKEQADEK